MTALRTPAQAREALEREGRSIADFCREHELDAFTVYQVLAGKKKGKRGMAHRAAVLLGIKDGEINVAKPEQYGPAAQGETGR
ncbi:DNA-binding protein [Pseudomonas sp. CBMAI 2609]|uniref:DNA-binding protein n=1 Tax=Pseudomonas flavocrustae TaxID=2991719 RepID=A0ABT6IGK0_9PSED|nr:MULTISPECIES: hypothetical protein [unclassified Pseudomonas]MDH4763393.1 DNA-binding protein [Pseudomonas sp. CBMAI 2609]